MHQAVIGGATRNTLSGQIFTTLPLGYQHLNDLAFLGFVFLLGDAAHQLIQAGVALLHNLLGDLIFTVRCGRARARGILKGEG